MQLSCILQPCCSGSEGVQLQRVQHWRSESEQSPVGVESAQQSVSPVPSLQGTSPEPTSGRPDDALQATKTSAVRAAERIYTRFVFVRLRKLSVVRFGCALADI